MADPPESFRAAAFDLDGTLIDTLPDLAAAVNLMLGMLGARELAPSAIRALVGGGVEKLVHRALAESLGEQSAHAAQRSAAVTLFGRLYGQALFERSQLYPGVEAALRALSAAGVGLCCVTNKDSRFATPLLERAGLRRFFAFTLCADTPEERKPSPHLLLSACSRLGIAPAQMVYVGDSRVDIAAARAAGCRVVVVRYGYDTPALLEQAQPDAIVDTLADLPSLRLSSAPPDATRAPFDQRGSGATPR
ncbi:MAG TPA: phosphoglycolate phosphatase [Steroidobacteraceae bacterium]|nr:phosphoglycolate phosphatase [Steroidobacteraceae bacterium]